MCLPPDEHPSLQCKGKASGVNDEHPSLQCADEHPSLQCIGKASGVNGKHPSLKWIGKAKGVNASQWAVDQRAFVWIAKPDEKPAPRALWAAWTDTFYPGAAPPFACVQTMDGGSSKPFQADSSLGLGSRPRASETTPGPEEIEIQRSKVWDLQKNGQGVATPASPSFLSSPFRAVNRGDTTRPSLSKNGSVMSSASSLTLSIPVDSDSTQASHPIDPWKSPRSKEEMSHYTSCVKELIENGRMHTPGGLKRKLSSDSASIGKTSTITHHKERHYNNRLAASKKKISTSNMDVDMPMIVADIEDPSDDEGEGCPAVSEKRRKRMLSNRASAQRSRQRRQERLDTLEVLVAELRVKNAALSRKANSAASVAKKLAKENSILQDRLQIVPISPSNGSNESDKTTENSNVPVNAKNLSSWRRDILSSRDESCKYDEDISPETCLSRAPSQALEDKRDGKPVENSRRCNVNNSGNSFNSDLMENAAYREISGTVLTDNSRGVDVEDQYQSAIMNLAQNNSFQSRDQVGVDLRQCYLEMVNTQLDSRFVEDIWEDSLTNCMM